MNDHEKKWRWLEIRRVMHIYNLWKRGYSTDYDLFVNLQEAEFYARRKTKSKERAESGESVRSKTGTAPVLCPLCRHMGAESDFDPNVHDFGDRETLQGKAPE